MTELDPEFGKNLMLKIIMFQSDLHVSTSLNYSHQMDYLEENNFHIWT